MNALRMILYPRAYGGLPALLTFYGSVIPRTILPALFGAGLTILIELTVNHKYLTDAIPSPYPYGVFTTVVSFLLVFRVNASYSRYWEACQTLLAFGSKLGDAMAEAMTDDIVWTKSKPDAPDMDFELYRGQLAHLSSLHHALALSHLRGQKEHDTMHDVLYFKATPDGKTHDSYAQAENPGRGGCTELIRAWCRTRSGERGYQSFLKEHPLYVLGGVSAAELAMLKPLSSIERFSAVHAHLLALFQARRSAGGMTSAEGPAFARLGNYLSAGNSAFYQASKILDTPLPFAYQQICSLALALFVVTFPVVCVSRFGGLVGDTVAWLPPIASFLSTIMFYGLYEVSREMEEPFLNPPNTIPFLMAQNAFNCRIVATAVRLTQLSTEVEDGVYPKGMLGVQHNHQDDPARVLTRSWQSKLAASARSPESESKEAATASMQIDNGPAGGAPGASLESRQRLSLTSRPSRPSRAKMTKLRSTAQVVSSLTHDRSIRTAFEIVHVP